MECVLSNICCSLTCECDQAAHMIVFGPTYGSFTILQSIEDSLCERGNVGYDWIYIVAYQVLQVRLDLQLIEQVLQHMNLAMVRRLHNCQHASLGMIRNGNTVRQHIAYTELPYRRDACGDARAGYPKFRTKLLVRTPNGNT